MPSLPPPGMRTKWTQTVPAEGEHNPEGRIGHTLCVNNEEDQILMYGGVNDTTDSNSNYLGDLQVFDFKTKKWKKVTMKGSVQKERAFHTAIFHNNLMWVFGGCNGRGRFNRLFTIQVDGSVETVESSDAPATRYCHSATLFDDKMYIFAGKNGGRNSNKRLQDLWVFDLIKKRWSECEQRGAIPSARSAHAAFTFGRSMVMFGGRNEQGECCEDLHRFNYDTQMWTNLDTKQSLFGRARHSVVVHNGTFVVFGGWNGRRKLNDLFYFNMDSQTFDLVPDIDEGCPSRRECHVAIMCKNTMVVFGGRFRNDFMRDTCELELGSKRLKDFCRDWFLSRSIDLPMQTVPLRVREYFEKWKDFTEQQPSPVPQDETRVHDAESEPQ